MTTEQTNEVECVFVGGPLHGLHLQDITQKVRVVQTPNALFCYHRYTTSDNQYYYTVTDIRRSPQTAG